MRIVDVSREEQVRGMSLFVTLEEAERFREQLQAYLVAPRGVTPRVDLVDHGDGFECEKYAVRTLSVILVDDDNAEEVAELPEAYREVVRDYDAVITHVKLD